MKDVKGITPVGGAQDLDMQKLYQITKDVINLFDKYSIKYWADGGTYLGAIRHSGIIPWDDDVDLGTLENNLTKINSKSFKKDLHKLNYKLISTDFGFKIFPTNGLKIKLNKWVQHINKFKEKNPHIRNRSQVYKLAAKSYNKSDYPDFHVHKYPSLDIFLYVNTNDQLHTRDRTKWYSDKCAYHKKNLTKLTKKKFGNYTLSVMPNSKKYFDKCYGSDWNKYGYITWDHKNEKFHKNRRKIPLTKKNRLPAKGYENIK
tara:strand:- start:172 stop:948 length:777 start_codon:yes stop_codon:yes gene_type:complete